MPAGMPAGGFGAPCCVQQVNTCEAVWSRLGETTMVRTIKEEEMNRLIAELCAARAEEAVAIEEANALATAARRPYTA